MIFRRLQHLSAWLFSALRRWLRAVGAWVQVRPRLAAWIFPARDGEDLAYREHNEQLYARFHEQERMLADQPRMAFYQTAIARQIGPGDRVIDLGTGTGILAAMASRAGAGHVYAIDHSPILRHARALAAANGIANVEFVATHSSAFQTEQRVDVILHEQMGDSLFDEGMLKNIVDLRDRLLRPGGRILPSRFELFFEPMQLNGRRQVPFIWELNVHGYDYATLAGERPADPSYYHLVSTDRELVDHFLGEPSPLLTVDLETVDLTQLPHSIVFSRRVQYAGRLDAFVVFFRTHVNDLMLTTDPTDPNRAPHWGYGILRTDFQQAEVNDVIEVRLNVGQWENPDTWHWSHRVLRTGATHDHAPMA
ncbi:methyltransferase domain-containing protein [Opitutus terrae]|uniref:Ribosomal protein L11 methylase-like protein n=1 Tax=Opitutus terrae (strain DSM 11246 / JCM 15787 / PB90-1) TaxID=452637 RepID=B1ZZK0_OPITP|nr:methyltransferase domain-containing protein [Opitutus terrae]ACB76403.1 Ribosomal protein L11 methylase-like protein [Opitutus terrae PB90-1]